jgi:hypothetical protein
MCERGRIARFELVPVDEAAAIEAMSLFEKLVLCPVHGTCRLVRKRTQLMRERPSQPGADSALPVGARRLSVVGHLPSGELGETGNLSIFPIFAGSPFIEGQPALRLLFQNGAAVVETRDRACSRYNLLTSCRFITEVADGFI